MVVMVVSEVCVLNTLAGTRLRVSHNHQNFTHLSWEKIIERRIENRGMLTFPHQKEDLTETKTPKNKESGNRKKNRNVPPSQLSWYVR